MKLILGGFSLDSMHTHLNERGQVAIEFILTFAFGLGIVFLISIQGLNVTKGFFVQYANYMASRAYLVDDRGVDIEQTMLQRAQEKALQVFDSYSVDEIGVQATNQIVNPQAGRGIYVGSTVLFSEPISALPIIGGATRVNLYAESFLGREPFRITCFQQTCQALTGSVDGCGDNGDMVVYDNGC